MFTFERQYYSERYADLHTLGSEWMIEQVESGKINLEDHIKTLSEKYNMI